MIDDQQPDQIFEWLDSVSLDFSKTAQIKTIKLAYCEIEYTETGCITRFNNGTSIEAQPHDTAHYHVISHRCGYGDNIMAYCREHEFAHSFISERFFDTESWVLRCLASNSPTSPEVAAPEEITAQTFQRWLRANERPITGGVDWDALKRDALQLLDGVAA